MTISRFFHLDCQPIISECGFRCANCIQEIRSVLMGLEGVSNISRGQYGEIAGIVVEFDSGKISIKDLLDAFRKLPSFYKGSFVPQVMLDWQGQTT